MNPWYNVIHVKTHILNFIPDFIIKKTWFIDVNKLYRNILSFMRWMWFLSFTHFFTSWFCDKWSFAWRKMHQMWIVHNVFHEDLLQPRGRSNFPLWHDLFWFDGFCITLNQPGGVRHECIDPSESCRLFLDCGTWLVFSHFQKKNPTSQLDTRQSPDLRGNFWQRQRNSETSPPAGRSRIWSAPHVTRHTSPVTRHPSHVTRPTSDRLCGWKSDAEYQRRK